MNSRRHKQVKAIATKIFRYLPLPTSMKAKLKVYNVVGRFLIPKTKAKEAEANLSMRRKLLMEKEKSFPSYYFKYESMAKQASTYLSSDERARGEIMEDMLFCYFSYGYTPNEYLCYGFKDKDWDERKKFISDRESVKYAYRLNNVLDMHIFMDKGETYSIFKDYYKRDVISLHSQADLGSFANFTKKHSAFVKKIACEACGRGTELIDLSVLEEPIDSIFEKFLAEGRTEDSNIILEELVQQSPIMEALNKSSLNSVRCMTLRTDNGICFPFCFLRCGRKGAFVDNGGMGGLIIGLDPQTGCTTTDAVDERGNHYQVHPDTGINFLDFRIPNWNDMLSICTDMASKIDSVKWIGWDMAYTPKGWVVIEGNGATEAIGPQSTSQKEFRSTLDRYLEITHTYF